MSQFVEIYTAHESSTDWIWSLLNEHIFYMSAGVVYSRGISVNHVRAWWNAHHFFRFAMGYGISRVCFDDGSKALYNPLNKAQSTFKTNLSNIILLMENILHHLLYMKPYPIWDILWYSPYQLASRNSSINVSLYWSVNRKDFITSNPTQLKWDHPKFNKPPVSNTRAPKKLYTKQQ